MIVEVFIFIGSSVLMFSVISELGTLFLNGQTPSSDGDLARGQKLKPPYPHSKPCGGIPVQQHFSHDRATLVTATICDFTNSASSHWIVSVTSPGGVFLNLFCFANLDQASSPSLSTAVLTGLSHTLTVDVLPDLSN